jgi:hypothetical protein
MGSDQSVAVFFGFFLDPRGFFLFDLWVECEPESPPKAHI